MRRPCWKSRWCLLSRLHLGLKKKKMLFFKVHSAFTPNKITQHTQKTTCNQHGMNPVNQISCSTPLTSEQILFPVLGTSDCTSRPSWSVTLPLTLSFTCASLFTRLLPAQIKIISPEAPAIPRLAATPCDVTYWSPVRLTIS